jgi:8-oxo-dGTP diphosphatase
MNSKTKRIAIAVVRQGENFLVGKRSDGVPLAGFWEFPGGKVESDETFEQAAMRECLEETGLRVCVKRLLMENYHEYPHGRLQLQFIECDVPADTQTSLAVHEPFEWVKRSDLGQLRFPDANRGVVDLLTK